jgi:kynureninase
VSLDLSLAYAELLDAEDELASWREQFVFSDPNLIYLDGNSLGRLPRVTAERIARAVEHEWGERLIRGWGEGWYGLPRRTGEKMAELVGAAPGQVLVSEPTTTSLFKLAVAALRMRPGRKRILSDVLNFPTDLYMLQGCIDLLHQGHELNLVHDQDGIHADQQAILNAIDEDTALVSLSTPTFKSGYLYDVPAITRRAHEMGALVLWDFSHAVGVMPLHLDEWNVDFAVGCTYKYLNAGPGAPAFLYVRKDLQEAARSPIWGWWGHAQPFAFDLDYRPAGGINQFLVSSTPVFSTLSIEPSIDMVLQAGVDRIRHKSIGLTSYLVDLAETMLLPLGFTLGSPRDPQRRGSHVSLRHAEGYRITRALIEEMHVIPDFREPDNIRLGLAPLYTTYADIWHGIDRLRQVVVQRRYEKYSHEWLEIT